MPYRIAFLTTHPIQYQVPIFRLLAQHSEIDFTALFCHMPDGQQQGDGFGVAFQWDVPLLDGYAYTVLKNVSRRPSVTSFGGCDTPHLVDELERRQVDVLIVNGWIVKSCLQGLRAARTLRIPCIVRGEANLLRRRAWWKRQLHRQLMRQYAAFLYIGKANRDFYRAHGVPDSKMFPARYCVENDRFTSAAASPGLRESVRRRYGIPDDAVCFLFSGKFEAKKHPVDLVRAFVEVVETVGRTGGVVGRPATAAGVHLLMVGDGELRPQCESLARSENVPVTLAGFLNQSEMPGAYAAADCLVLPSDHGETWGLVVNEAMACGRPAIVSNQTGCAADLILENKTGSVFRFGDWNDLSRQMLRMAEDRDRLEQLGFSAQRHIAGYSPESAAQGILTAVKSLTGLTGQGR